MFCGRIYLNRSKATAKRSKPRINLGFERFGGWKCETAELRIVFCGKLYLKRSKAAAKRSKPKINFGFERFFVLYIRHIKKIEG